MGTINSSDRIAATLYFLRTWFVSGIYVYIPCIKEIVSLPIIIIIIIIIICKGRSNITYSTNFKYKKTATLHPRNMFCFRYIIVNTLHKGDNKDNNNNNNNK
jgi:hypothetical protein